MFMHGRAITYEDCCDIHNKERDALVDAYITTWAHRNGPFQVAIMDGETGTQTTLRREAEC